MNRRLRNLAMVLISIVALILLAGDGSRMCAMALAPGVVMGQTVHQFQDFTVVHIDLRKTRLSLFWKGMDGLPLRNFGNLSDYLALSHRRLIFATNAGIFEPGWIPTGLCVQDGNESVPLNLNAGMGNFYLMPNGIFVVDVDGARIVESHAYAGTKPNTRLATQSGPMLVLNNEINPAFKPESENRQIRSGVGVASADDVFLAISREPISFFELASLFQTQLKCKDALYLDGSISQFFPATNLDGPIHDFTGILAVSASQ